MRYFIAYPVPQDFDRQFRSWYSDTFQETLPVQKLHLTLIPPFTLKSDVDLRQIENTLTDLDTPSIKLIPDKFGSFSQMGEPSLYLSFKTNQDLVAFRHALDRLLQPLIDYDTSVYDDHEVPEFIPHVTLSYNFPHPIPQTLPNFPSPTLQKPQIFKNQGPR